MVNKSKSRNHKVWHITSECKIPLTKLLNKLGFAASVSEARRLIQQGAVKLKDKDSEKKVKDTDKLITSRDIGSIIKVGIHRTCKLEK